MRNIVLPSPVPIYTPPVPPPPTYSCGHCGKVIPRAMALRQAGYCESCEWMTTAQVVRRLLINSRTLRQWTAAGKIPRYGAWRNLYHRADVEAKRLSRQSYFAS